MSPMNTHIPVRYKLCLNLIHSFVYDIAHNMCAHTHHTRSASRTHCADYLQSDARGEDLTPT